MTTGKPEEIPQDVWLLANAAYREWLDSPPSVSTVEFFAIVVMRDRAARGPSIAMAGLTRPQSQVLTAIAAFVAARGYSPTFQEIAAATGLSSKSRVHAVAQQLVERGAITMRMRQARSIRLLEVSTAHKNSEG